MKKRLLFALFILSNSIYAQVGINTESPKSTLDIMSKDPNNPSSTDGLLVPRVVSNPSTGNDVGQLIFNTTENKFFYWTGSSWSNLTNQNFIKSISLDTNTSQPITISNTDTSEKLIPGLSRTFDVTETSVINFIANVNFKSSNSAFQPKFFLKLKNNTTQVETVINNVTESYISDGTFVTVGNLLLVSMQTLQAGSYTVSVSAFYESCCPYVFSYTTGGANNRSSLLINNYN